jgi:solute carrier family 15 (peptide/histidine transporter), member 3/4
LSSAIGIGAVQANMAVFGAEQVREQKATTRFFDAYYAAVNTGGLLAYAAIAYLQLKSYFIGYVVPGGLLVVAFLCFLAGTKSYFYTKPHDSVVTNFFPVLWNAIQSWRKHDENLNAYDTNDRTASPVSSLERHDRVRNDEISYSTTEPTWSFLDYAKIANNGRFLDREVDDIKSLRPVIVVFLLLIPYWLLYVQVTIINDEHFICNDRR